MNNIIVCVFFSLVYLLCSLLILGKVDRDRRKHVLIILFFVYLSGFATSWSIFSKFSYKQGQIDVFSGKIKYRLVEKDDLTKDWEEINLESIEKR